MPTYCDGRCLRSSLKKSAAQGGQGTMMLNSPLAFLTLFVLLAPNCLAQTRQSEVNFFRINIKAAYFEKSIEMNVVSSCINEASGRKLHPAAVGVRLSDGKVLFARIPAICAGETTDNGQVPVDLLPFLVVYDDDKLEFGTGYATLDGYENRRSHLRFISARVEASNEAEFLNFSNTSIASRDLIVKARDSYFPGQICFGVAKFQISGKLQQRIRTEFFGGVPLDKYRATWWVPSIDDFAELKRGDIEIPFSSYVRGLHPNTPELGMPTRSGFGRVLLGNVDVSRQVLPSEVYPNSGPWTRPWPKDAISAARSSLQEGSFRSVAVETTDSLGLTYCYTSPAFFFPEGRRIIPSLTHKFTVEGTNVEAYPSTSNQGPAGAIFFGDQFAFLRVDYNVLSPDSR